MNASSPDGRSSGLPLISSLRVLPLLAALAGSRILCAAAGAAEPFSTASLKQMSLEDLLNLEVTSVSRTEESYHDVAAALSVVTNEQIRRSGATTVPDALRLVPGLHVARRNSNSWAVSSRGFSSVNSEKLLVQSDTRSIYTPLFSGVFWDVQDYLLEDIDRIEVIRGPGAAVWGSNAVNGVINITTKSAADTHGTLIETSAGTEEHASVAARYGGQTSGGVHYRVFGKYVDRDESVNTSSNSDDWQLAHVGFRADWSADADNEFTVQSDVYRGDIGQLTPAITIIGRPGPAGPLNTVVDGGNVLGRWRHHFADTSELQFRAYYDHTYRNDPSFTDELDTVDLDLQHQLVRIGAHDLMWGVNYRYTSNRNRGKGIFAVRPGSSQDNLFSSFAQDQVGVTDAFKVTLGTKIEHNDFSGWELQPSIRAAWELSRSHTLWAAVSRAARIPTRFERDIFIDVSNPAGNPVFRLLGNDEFDAEELVAYEAGYRWRASDQLHLDVSVFDNHYEGLSSLEFGTTFTDPSDGRTVIPIVNRNLTDGRSQGVEVQVDFSPISSWRFSGSYAYEHLNLEPSGDDLNRGAFYEGATPRHIFGLGSYLTLPGGLELDAQLRRLSAIRQLPEIPSGEGLPAYTELDVHVSWRATESLTLSVVGQNLLSPRHVEFGSPEARGAVARGGYAKLSWEF